MLPVEDNTPYQTGARAPILPKETGHVVMPQKRYTNRNKNRRKKEPGQFMETRSASDIEKSTEKLLENLRDIVRDGEELLKAGGEELSDRGSAAREKLSAALEVARETQEKLREQAIAGAQATDRVIRQHPYQAIGLALGVGLLIGVLASRR